MWRLTSGFPGTVHRHLHTLGVDGHLGRGRADEDVQVETLPPPAPPDKPEIVELGHVVLHHGRVVPQLPTEVLVVAGPEGDHGAVANLAEGDHLEGHRQRLVRPEQSESYYQHQNVDKSIKDNIHYFKLYEKDVSKS